MKPTVSDSRNGRLSKTTLRTVVSSVAKSCFSAKTSLLAMRFIKGRFPDVGVAYQCDAHQLSAIRPLYGHLTVDFLQILFQFGDAVADDAAVGLDFAFAGTAARARAAALPFEVRPQA